MGAEDDSGPGTLLAGDCADVYGAKRVGFHLAENCTESDRLTSFWPSTTRAATLGKAAENKSILSPSELE